MVRVGVGSGSESARRGQGDGLALLKRFVIPTKLRLEVHPEGDTLRLKKTNRLALLLVAVIHCVPMSGIAEAKLTMGGPYGGKITTVAIDPIHPNILFAGTEHGLYRSKDSGDHWHELTNGLSRPWPESIAINPQNPQVVLVETRAGLYRSSDGGNSWMPLDEPSSGSVVFGGGTKPRLWLVGYGGLHTSMDSGDTWSRVFDARMMHFDVARSDPNTAYAATETGVYRTSDGGKTWIPSESRSFKWIAVSSSDPDTIYGVPSSSASPELMKSTDGGVSWQDISSSLDAHIYRVYVAPSSPQTIYAVGWTGANLGYTARSDDGGETWKQVYTFMETHESVTRLAIAPGNASRVYAATDREGFMRSSDAAETFKSSNHGITTAVMTAVAVDPLNPNTVYSAAWDGAYVSHDGGASWDALNTTEPPYPDRTIWDLVVTPTTVYAGGGANGSWSKVIRSTDSGRTWDMSAEWPDVREEVASLEWDPTRSLLYARGYNSWGPGEPVVTLYSSNDDGVTWTAIRPVSDSLAGMAVHPSTGKIYASFKGAEGLRLFSSADGAATWEELNSPDPDTAGVVTTGPSEDSVYAASGNELFKSEDGGLSWTTIPLPPDEWLSGSVVVDPLDQSQVIVGTTSGPYFSRNEGQSWQLLGPTGERLWLRGATFALPVDLGISTDGTVPVYMAVDGAGVSGVWKFIPRPNSLDEVTIVGSMTPQQSLKCKAGAWSRASRFTYRWMLDGQVVERATSRRYWVRKSDVGRFISCQVTAFGPGGKDRASTEAAVIRRK